jgi:hypothetical protein
MKKSKKKDKQFMLSKTFGHRKVREGVVKRMYSVSEKMATRKRIRWLRLMRSFPRG